MSRADREPPRKLLRMTQPAWQFEYSIEAEVRPEFAWQFWTNVANWMELEPGIQFEMDGPFAKGARGTTRMPGQEPRHWMIVELDPGRSCTTEMPLPGASFSCRMQFEEDGAGTRITQKLWLQGENAQAYLEGIRLFETTTPDGLKRIAAVLAAAQSAT
jgi:polyketide cyclase/dehydrase/lipid transport protein